MEGHKDWFKRWTVLVDKTREMRSDIRKIRLLNEEKINYLDSEMAELEKQLLGIRDYKSNN